MPRLFFALWPDDTIRSQLQHIAQQFKDENIRLVSKSNLHITLEFLGETDSDVQQNLIRHSAQINAEPFELILTRINWWQRPGILCIETDHVPPSLTALVKTIKKLARKNNIKTDKRPYKPHVTFARKVKRITLPNKAIEIHWQANSFALVESKSTETGVEYQVIQEWPFNIV